MRDERLYGLFEPMSSLPGVGPKTAAALSRLCGGETVWDILAYLPARWEDRRLKTRIMECRPGETASVRGTVAAIQDAPTQRHPLKVKLEDETGAIDLVFFGMGGAGARKRFPVGSERIASGRIELYDFNLQMSRVDHILSPSDIVTLPEAEPIYRKSGDLTNRKIRDAAGAALERVASELPEWIDAALLKREGWPGFREALETIHAPTSYDMEAAERALDRLGYDEALAREVHFALAREARQHRRAHPMPPAPKAQERLLQSLPFSPTGAQSRAAAAIAADLAEARPMRRMVQGDVGSGKTLVAALAAVQVLESRFQAAFMAPTEVLARQQYAVIDAWLSPLGYEVAALTGRDKGKARDGLLIGLADGSIGAVCGTHALFQETVDFKALGLVVVDEQHRFGVADRTRLASKALSPHMLSLSATPIPRTLSMAMDGDLDVTILDEKPPGRMPVETRILSTAKLGDIIAATGRAIERGERVFWVCPKVDSGEGASAVGRQAMLSDALRVPVGLVHGRMRGDQKEDALDAFRRGDTRILVATTVIEVGVDVPEATIMVIEEADTFGLAQLHQLRGRVGRGGRQGYCLLVYSPPLGETAATRLTTLRKTEDGFAIAEADFELRGPGDALGTRQSGLLDLVFLDLPAQSGLVEIARKDARLLVGRDAAFQTPRGQAVSLLRDLLGPSARPPGA